MSLLFALRFDLRNPEFAGTDMADRYAAALDMAEWADDLGCVSIAISDHSVSDGAALRASGNYAVVTPDEYTTELRAAPFPFAFPHPLCGGMPIDLAWSSLRLFEREVLPAFV